MTQLTQFTLAALLLCVLTGATSGAPNALDKEWAKIENPAPNVSSRGIMGFVLEAAGGPDAARFDKHIETALQDLEKMQDRDPASRSYGNFCWYWHEAKPGDANAVEFITQQAALLQLRYANRLSPQARDSLKRLLELSIEGIHRQKVDVGYTNIFLMKTWNLLALGEALKRPELTREGEAMLDQWMAATARNGIREYLSPTYYGVDLESLALMARALDNPPVREKATRILRLFWTDIAANWFEPAGRLGGAHGRDYDYLTGHGYLDTHLLHAGWIDAKHNKPPVFQVFAEATYWMPTEDLHRMAMTSLPRFVYQKWDAQDTAWTSHYLGRHFSIGVSGESQGPEDKPFAINLASPEGAKSVMVNFFMDSRNDPYGKNKVPTGASGHQKSHHLVPLFHAVQEGPEVLFLASHPWHSKKARKPESAPICLLSHLDLPLEAEIWTADHVIALDQTSATLPGNLCFLRLGDVAVGISFPLALDTAGKPVTANVVNDGAAYHARRITVTHSAGPPSADHGTVAVWVRAAEGIDDAGFAAFRRSFREAKISTVSEGDVVRVQVPGLKGSLALDVDLANDTLLHSEGTDAAMQSGVMSINGKDFSKDLLAQ